MPSKISLPPPIRDPVSGKVFVAIPAPPFVLAQDGSELDDSHAFPGYVYVERKVAAAGRVFNKDRTSMPLHKPSIGQWTSSAVSSPPPPKHIPWKGDVSPSSSAGSIPKSKDSQSTPESKRSRCSSSRRESCNLSSSSIELPSFESGFSLLRGRLPTVSSVTDSESSANISVPSFSEVTSCRPHSHCYAASQCSRSSESGANERRQTLETLIPNNREAHVFRRRPELGSVETPRQSAILTPQFKPLNIQSGDWDDSEKMRPVLEEGVVGDEETPVQRSRIHLDNPSLVVSSSHHVALVSLDSARLLQTKDDSTQPLNIVKKNKRQPAPLKLDTLSKQSPDYPDIPTPFCSSPQRASLRDTYASSVFPRIRLDTKLTTEEMIESLLKQVEQFRPRLPLSVSPTDLGYTALSDANKQGDCSSNVVGLGLELERPLEAIDTSISPTPADRLHSIENVSKCADSKPSAVLQVHSTTPLKPSIVSGRARSGTNSSGCSDKSEKRVRFNSGLNRRISAIIPEKDEPISPPQKSPPRSPPTVKAQRQPPSITSEPTGVSLTSSSPKRICQTPTQAQTSPRRKGTQLPSPQKFKTIQYQKRSSMHRMSLASAGLMDLKPTPEVSSCGTSAPSSATSTPALAFATMSRATPTGLIPRRRMTDTSPSPSITPKSLFSRAYNGTPTPAQGTHATIAARRMTLATSVAPRMRGLTMGISRGKENRNIGGSTGGSVRSSEVGSSSVGAGSLNAAKAKENKENGDKDKDRDSGKRVKASEAMLARKKFETDENDARRGKEEASNGKGLIKSLPFQGMLNRLKA